MPVTGLAAKVRIELQQLGIADAGQVEYAVSRSIHQGIEPAISEFFAEQFQLLSGASRVFSLEERKRLSLQIAQICKTGQENA